MLEKIRTVEGRQEPCKRKVCRLPDRIYKWKQYTKRVVYALIVIGLILLAGCQKERSKQEQEGKVGQITQNGILFSHDSGLYEAPELKVHMKAPEGYTIAFTTDGTKPSAKNASGKSELDVILKNKMSGYLLEHKQLMLCPEFYNSVLYQDHELPAGVVLNTALVDANGAVDSKIQTNVYFLNENFAKRFPNCLIISITTDQRNLLDYNTGILASGAVYDAWKKTDEGKKLIASQEWWEVETNSTQHGKKWERPCQIQFYTKGSKPVLEMNAGLRVRGGMSRRQNQKSFTLYFRDNYGSDKLHFALFDKINDYKTFALRNGGNDSEYLKFKDAFLQDLGKGGKFTVLDSRQAVVFLNGEYWGPYSLNELVSGNTMQTRFAVDPDNVVVIKESEVQVGKKEDIRYYDELRAFDHMDLTDSDVYRRFCKVMDVQAMADYFAMRIYIGDSDWSRVHNHILWRTKDKSYNGGRWQFIVHDTDYSAGHYGERKTSPATDHFRLAIENFPVFGAALKNKEFYNIFLASIKKIGSENYKFSRVREEMDAYDKVWEPLMRDFYKRFGDTSRLRKQCMNSTLSFFQRRYNIIIPIVEKWIP